MFLGGGEHETKYIIKELSFLMVYNHMSLTFITYSWFFPCSHSSHHRHHWEAVAEGHGARGGLGDAGHQTG